MIMFRQEHLLFKDYYKEVGLKLLSRNSVRAHFNVQNEKKSFGLEVSEVQELIYWNWSTRKTLI